MPQALSTAAGPRLTRILAGPLCTMMLGDMGADVIKVEPPGGDDTRTWGPPFVGGEPRIFSAQSQQALAHAQHGGKPRPGVSPRLIEKSDVLVDNFKLGTLAKWGFTDAWFESTRRGSCAARSPATARAVRRRRSPATTSSCRPNPG
jgi:crotonobetainyl-CoA:carnitine CoA-transferase CaiB-like acyl-CoA transferase